MKLLDISNQRFGRLLVLNKDAQPRMWLCICDCGLKKLVTGSNLRSGATKSCGCLALEWAKELGSNKEILAVRSKSAIKHGQKLRSKMSVEYSTWLRIKRRCYDENDKDYANWGGRGIRVCDRWISSFENFYSDIGERPQGRYSIDRLDPNKDYGPTNCRWATELEQSSENRRTLIPVFYLGVRYHSVSAACSDLGLKYTTIMNRIDRGVPVDDALSAGNNRLQKPRSRESYIRKILR